MNLIRRFFGDMLTGPDNTTFEVAHILWVSAVVCFLIFTGYVVWHTKAFDLTNYGTGFGLIMAGGAGGSFARAKADETLPAPPPSP